jgi:hypothetical protein
LIYEFDLSTGILINVENSLGKVSFSGGPRPAGLKSEIKNVSWYWDQDNALIIDAKYDPYPSSFYWKIHKNGLLEFEASPNLSRLSDIDFLGLSFNYPEGKVQSMQWLGRGPYRVWKNRIHGTNFNLWGKKV